MISLNELAYDLLEIVRPTISDDDDIDLRQIKFWIHNQRALWLRNELNKNRTIDDNIIQDLGCIELELVDKAECAEISVDCNVLRTKSVIPNTIELHNSTSITRVGPISKQSKAFSFVPYSQAIYSGNGRFNRFQRFAYLLNDRIYIKTGDNTIKGNLLTHINVRGVFENPAEVASFTDEDGKPCYTDNSKYPVNRWMIDYMKDQIIKGSLRMTVSAPSDDSNDADSQTTEATSQPTTK